MSSETTIVAAQYRLQEWAAQIRDCQNRPEGMSIADWCSLHGITKPNYYYRLRRVRKACLAALPEKTIPQPVVPVKAELLKPVEPEAVLWFVYFLHVSDQKSVLADSPMRLFPKLLGNQFFYVLSL